MPDLLLAVVGLGGYISEVKLVIFVALLFAPLLLLKRFHQDAEAVGAEQDFWTAVGLAAWFGSAIIWLLVPIFAVGMVFYLLAVGAAFVSYLVHRDAGVAEYEKLLSFNRLAGLLSSEQKKLDKVDEGFLFITANNNEVPVPAAKTPDFFGYKKACDIVRDALSRRAGYINFSPRPESYKVTYNIDGAAVDQPEMPKDQVDYFAHFLKEVAGLDSDEKRKPQKGRFIIHHNKKNIEWELTTAGSTAGEQMQIKHLTQENITRLADLGLEADQYEQLDKIEQASHGLFIVSGTRHSGVTSTFYSLLRNHDAFLNSISTLEKKPTVDLLNITQNVFTLADTGTTTYAKRLQAIVRMGADVVGAADCEDVETAKAACKAAADHKIVYVTLDAENAVKALGKWIKLVTDRDLVAQTLLGITNQRLLRILCQECKQAYEPNQQLLRKFNIPADKAKVLYRAGKVVYDKRGRESTCQTCLGTGYVGRMAIFELVMIDDALRKVIGESNSLSEIATQFRRAKMLYLQEQAMKKVLAGTTSINEMVRVLSHSRPTGPQANPEGAQQA